MVPRHTGDGHDTQVLIVFLHGFASIPQRFAELAAALSQRGTYRFCGLSLPGYGRSPPFANCKIAGVARIIAAYISDLQSQGWERVVLIGHGLGGVIGWRVAHLLPNDMLSGFVTFSPHPHLSFQAVSQLPARRAPFYPLLSPVFAEALLGAKDFAPLSEMFKGEAWFDAIDSSDLRHEHLRVWKMTGAKRLSCYYRRNFQVEGGVVVPVEANVFEEIDPATNILMLHAERNGPAVSRLFQRSLGQLSSQRARVVRFRAIANATHHNILHTSAVSEVAQQIHEFIWASQSYRLSLMSRMGIVPDFTLDSGQDVSVENMVILYTIFISFIGMLAGITLELRIGLFDECVPQGVTEPTHCDEPVIVSVEFYALRLGCVRLGLQAPY